MSYIRWQIDLAVQEPISKDLETEMDELRLKLVEYQLKCVKINAGKPNEEDTTSMKEHVCNHDKGEACGPVSNIGV